MSLQSVIDLRGILTTCTCLPVARMMSLQYRLNYRQSVITHLSHLCVTVAAYLAADADIRVFLYNLLARFQSALGGQLLPYGPKIKHCVNITF